MFLFIVMIGLLYFAFVILPESDSQSKAIDSHDTKLDNGINASSKVENKNLNSNNRVNNKPPKIKACNLKISDKIQLSTGEVRTITDIKSISNPGKLLLCFGDKKVVVKSNTVYYLHNGIYTLESRKDKNIKNINNSSRNNNVSNIYDKGSSKNTNNQYDYKKKKYYVDSLVTPYLPDLYEQHFPILTKLMEKFWLDFTNNSWEEYRKFSQSMFADRLYEQHFFMAFVNGWKSGYFSLGQVGNYEEILGEELEEIYETVLEDALGSYEMKIASQFLYLTEVVYNLGFESGRKTNIN